MRSHLSPFTRPNSPFGLVLLVSYLLWLTACAEARAREISPAGQAPPTVMRVFAATPSTPQVVPADGIPTLSPHFAGGQALAEAASAVGTPTLSPRFSGGVLASLPATTGGTPTPASSFVQPTVYPTNTPRPTPTPRPPPITVIPSPTGEQGTESREGDAAARPQFTLISIYTDTLAAGWSVTESWGVRLDLQDTTYVHGGRHAIAVTPEEDFGSLFFTVVPGSPRIYPYDRTLGVRFWLNSGAEPLYLDQLAVTVLGSNAYTHWQKDDDSVKIKEGESFFSETRLYYLGLNRSLPAETWVEIVVWLDDLPFDPDYTYITGLYIKSEAGFRRTFYVDDVALVVLEA
jgi:hypothetical protein